MEFIFSNVAYASVDSFIDNVNQLIVNPLIILLFALAFLFFAYGIFEYLANQDNEEKRTDGKKHMLFGIIGMTVMIGVFFFMNLIIDSFDIKGVDPDAGTVDLPDYDPDWP